MKFPSLKKSLIAAALGAFGIFSSIAVADWVAKDANGINIIFDAFVNGTKILPKFAPTDPTGVQVGTDTNPLIISLSSASPPTVNAAQSGTWTVNAAQSGPWGVTPTGTWSVGQASPPWLISQSGAWSVGQQGTWTVGLNAGSAAIGNVGQASPPWGLNLTQVNGSALSLANALPAQLSLGGAVVSNANTVPVTCISGCSTAGSSLATYGIGATWTLAASPTDIAVLQGSDTKTIKVRRVLMTTASGTTSNMQVDFTRRSTADTAGTSQVVTAAKMDSLDAAASAVFRTYTVNPTGLGTSAGLVKTVLFGVNNSTTTNNPTPSQEYTFGELNSKPLILRGSSDFLAFNVAIGGGGTNFRFSIEWTEE